MALLAAFEVGRYTGNGKTPPDAVSVPADGAQRTSVVALARLEPGSRILTVGPAGPDIVARLLVKEGQVVEAKQALAYLKSYDVRHLEEQAAQVRLEQARLKPLEVDGQRAMVRAREAQLEHATAEVARLQKMLDRGLIASRELDEAKFQARRAKEELSQGQATLAEAERGAKLAAEEAARSLDLARAQREQSVVRTPIAGRVLRVLAQPGERVTGPFIELGATQHMYAVAEVHATDVRFLRVGQSATFSSPSLEKPLQGHVETIGEMIDAPAIFGEDPSRATNSKVFEVRIRLEPDARAETFSNLEGEARIALDHGTPS
jgi:HlyD family secretion protein